MNRILKYCARALFATRAISTEWSILSRVKPAGHFLNERSACGSVSSI